MEKGLIQVYSGEGHGKSAAALGRAIQVASAGEDVVLINFLKGYQNEAFLKRMEPEVKIFRFEKSEEEYAHLSDEHKQEEIRNIKNGLNFAKKVLQLAMAKGGARSPECQSVKGRASLAQLLDISTVPGGSPDQGCLHGL